MNASTKNIFGLEEWAKLGLSISTSQAQKFPWDKNVLQKECPITRKGTISDTHFVWIGPKKDLKSFTNRFLPSEQIDPIVRQLVSWMRKTKDLTFYWHITPLFIVFPPQNIPDDNLHIKTIPADYRISDPTEELMKHLLYFEKNSEFPTFSSLGWCSRNTAVGTRNSSGVLILESETISAEENIGLALSRKPENQIRDS